jgi:hypothetical protein
MSQFGDFGDFCRDSNIVGCNLFRNKNVPSCTLQGFVAKDGARVANLGISLDVFGGGLMVGDILLCGIALAVTIYLFYLTEKRKAAVGTSRALALRGG